MDKNHREALELEEEYKGVENHLVPEIPPGEDCNARRTDNKKDSDKGIRTIFVGYCKNRSGKGTDHVGKGRCKFHGGSIDDGGAPAHNQNAAESSLNADPHHYMEDLPDDEAQWVEGVSNSILNRVREIGGRNPDMIDRTLARLVSIEFHIAFKASDYTRDELVQVILHDGSSHEEPGALVEEVRRYTSDLFANLKKLGVLDDPQSQRTEELGEWREMLDDASADDSDIVEIESQEGD